MGARKFGLEVIPPTSFIHFLVSGLVYCISPNLPNLYINVFTFHYAGENISKEVRHFREEGAFQMRSATTLYCNLNT